MKRNNRVAPSDLSLPGSPDAIAEQLAPPSPAPVPVRPRSVSPLSSPSRELDPLLGLGRPNLPPQDITNPDLAPPEPHPLDAHRRQPPLKLPDLRQSGSKTAVHAPHADSRTTAVPKLKLSTRGIDRSAIVAAALTQAVSDRSQGPPKRASPSPLPRLDPLQSPSSSPPATAQRLPPIDPLRSSGQVQSTTEKPPEGIPLAPSQLASVVSQNSDALVEPSNNIGSGLTVFTDGSTATKTDVLCGTTSAGAQLAGESWQGYDHDNCGRLITEHPVNFAIVDLILPYTDMEDIDDNGVVSSLGNKLCCCFAKEKNTKESSRTPQLFDRYHPESVKTKARELYHDMLRGEGFFVSETINLDGDVNNSQQRRACLISASFELLMDRARETCHHLALTGLHEQALDHKSQSNASKAWISSSRPDYVAAAFDTDSELGPATGFVGFSKLLKSNEVANRRRSSYIALTKKHCPQWDTSQLSIADKERAFRSSMRQQLCLDAVKSLKIPTTLGYDLVVGPPLQQSGSEKKRSKSVRRAETMSRRRTMNAERLTAIAERAESAIDDLMGEEETITGAVFNISAASVFGPSAIEPPTLNGGSNDVNVCFMPDSFRFAIYDANGNMLTSGDDGESMLQNGEALYIDFQGAGDDEETPGFLGELEQHFCHGAVIVIERDSDHSVADQIADAAGRTFAALQSSLSIAPFWDHSENLQLPLSVIAHAANSLLGSIGVVVTDSTKKLGICTAGHLARPGAESQAICCCVVLSGDECPHSSSTNDLEYCLVVEKDDLDGPAQVLTLGGDCQNRLSQTYYINNVKLGWNRDRTMSATAIPITDPSIPVFYGTAAHGESGVSESGEFHVAPMYQLFHPNEDVFDSTSTPECMSVSEFIEQAGELVSQSNDMVRLSPMTGFEDGLRWHAKCAEFKRGLLYRKHAIPLVFGSLTNLVSHESSTEQLYASIFGPHDRDVTSFDRAENNKELKSNLLITNWVSGVSPEYEEMNETKCRYIKDRVIDLLTCMAKEGDHSMKLSPPLPSAPIAPADSDGCFLVAATLPKSKIRFLEQAGPVTAWKQEVGLKGSMPPLRMTEVLTRENLLAKWTKSAFSLWMTLPALPWLPRRSIPVDEIRNYLGERVAFYYAWQHQQNRMLQFMVWPGIVVILYGIIEGSSKSDSSALFSILFDNDLTPAFAILMGIWSTLALELWKREQARLAHKWDVTEFESEEKIRAQFKPTVVKRDDVTGMLVLLFPYYNKIKLLFRSYAVILVAILVVCMAAVSVITTRILLAQSSIDSNVQAVIPALLQTILIIVLEFVYEKLARFLNDLENHRTQTSYDDHLIAKLFMFNFTNMYTPLFYIAFVQGRVALWNNDDYLETCGTDTESSCMKYLALQVATQIIVKPLVDIAKQNIIPIVKTRFKKKKANEKNWLDKELNLFDSAPLDEDYLVTEYNTKVLLFGLVTIFAAAFPLAPLLVLLMNMLDTRFDARRLLKLNKRVISLRSQDIGMWQTILEFINYVAVISNAFLIAFSSNFGKRLNHEYGSTAALIFLVSYEHILLVLKMAAASLIPDEPKFVTMQRETRVKKVVMFFRRHYKALMGGGASETTRPQVPSIQDTSVKKRPLKKAEKYSKGTFLADFTELACRATFRRFVPATAESDAVVISNSRAGQDESIA